MTLYCGGIGQLQLFLLFTINEKNKTNWTWLATSDIRIEYLIFIIKLFYFILFFIYHKELNYIILFNKRFLDFN